MSVSAQLGGVMPRQHRIDLDIVKAIAIIAVVFYHIGWLDTGYLGVDVFFAINGFLIIPSLVKQISENTFKYPAFLLKRIMRLWPLVLLGSALCLLMGYWCMLPDDYENLSQSVIASDFLSQNVLSAITTRNYWDSSNEYKPLMHFWYVGILAELYVVLPLILMCVRLATKRIRVDFTKIAFLTLSALAVGSFVLYLLPNISNGSRFYYLPFRLWELIAGGLIGLACANQKKSTQEILGKVAFVGIILVLCGSLYLSRAGDGINAVSGQVANTLVVPQNVLLILSVLFTCVLLDNPVKIRKTKISSTFSFVGAMSFSIFVWHQILLAFYRYLYGNNMTGIFVVGLWIATIVLSVVTYYTIEQKVKANRKNFVVCCASLVAICIPAGLVYVNAGVVRDVPELGLYVSETHRGQFAEYCDRVYSYNVDFPENDKINVLVAGVSFGRDFANILLESEWAQKMNLSYIYVHDEKYATRYADCDYFFTFNNKNDLPSYIWDNLNPEAKVYGVGTKNYGDCNGVIYNRRKAANYLEQTMAINPNFYLVNEEWKQAWGEGAYIDLLKLSEADNGEIRVFTDDKKLISQDCRHLTQAGAKWFAETINWSEIF